MRWMKHTWSGPAWGAIVGLLVAAGGCGASPQAVASPTAAPVPDLDARALLRGYAATNTEVLRVPEGSPEELQDRLRTLRGAERRRGMRDLAAAYALAAGQNESRAARRSRSDARRYIDLAGRRSRDQGLAAELLFLRLWMRWDSGGRNARSLAERLINRYGEQGGPVVTLAWMIRGEIAFGAERWEPAVDAFRFVRGQLSHPLYAYAMYRTAEAWEQLGRADEAQEGLAEVERLGCAEEAEGATLVLALRANRELGNTSWTDISGTERPARCQTETTTVNIEDERPPGQ